MRRLLLPLLLIASMASAEVNVMVEIPRIDASEYHRPYVAVWVEDGGHEVVANLAVWYAQKETRKAPAANGWPTCASGGGAAGVTRPCRLTVSAVRRGPWASTSCVSMRPSHRLPRSSRASTRWWSRRCAKWAAVNCCASRSIGRSPHPDTLMPGASTSSVWSSSISFPESGEPP